MTVKLISIPINRWSRSQRTQVHKWLLSMGYAQGYPRWYFDDHNRREDLVMNQEIFFMYQTAFGQVDN